MFRERIRDIGSRVYAYFLEPVFPCSRFEFAIVSINGSG